MYTFLSLPVVSNWLSSGWYSTILNKVLSNRHITLVKDLRSQIIQEPSALALTAYSLFLLTWIDHTLPLCSFIDDFITYVYLPISQTLTSPSDPPDIIL